MKCLRCGYCCKYLSAAVIDDPKKGIREDNVLYHRGDGTPCKHLLGEGPGQYSCALHNELWYKKTPCFAHGQIEESEDDLCRMGEYILSKLEKVGSVSG